jgi:hypothetical protein
VAQKTNSFLLTGTTEEDKAFADEPVIVETQSDSLHRSGHEVERCR